MVVPKDDLLGRLIAVGGERDQRPDGQPLHVVEPDEQRLFNLPPMLDGKDADGIPLNRVVRPTGAQVQYGDGPKTLFDGVIVVGWAHAATPQLSGSVAARPLSASR